MNRLCRTQRMGDHLLNIARIGQSTLTPPEWLLKGGDTRIALTQPANPPITGNDRIDHITEILA